MKVQLSPNSHPPFSQLTAWYKSFQAFPALYRFEHVIPELALFFSDSLITFL